MQFTFIWAIDRTLSGATILGQSGPRSHGRITGTSPSDCLASYHGHSLGGGFYPSAEV